MSIKTTKSASKEIFYDGTLHKILKEKKLSKCFAFRDKLVSEYLSMDVEN